MDGGKMRRWIGWALCAAVCYAAYACFGYNAPIPMPPIGQMGWVEDKDAVEFVASELRFKAFADTPAYAETADDDSDVFLWEPGRSVLGGKLLPGRNQLSVGSCVSFGTNSAIEHLLLVQASQGVGEYKDLVQEATYALSRVEIGGGKIRGDGSVGAWAAKAVRDYGVIARGVHISGGVSYDLTTYDVARCRDWGNKGLPDVLEATARLSPVKGITLVKTGAEAVKALRNGYPMAVCSNQGFSQTRDGEGFCKASGSWAHCMAIIGYRGGPRKGYFILNSWGEDYFRGPTGKGNPSPAGFWAEASTVERMLAQGDTWAFSEARGFPKKEIDWFVNNIRPQDKETELCVTTSLRRSALSRAFSLSPSVLSSLMTP